MAKIEGLKIKNYRVLRDLTLGKPSFSHDAEPLTPMTVVIGKNGVGKSSLFDAFGFLSDCLKLGVEEACDSRGRGGFDRIRSQGVRKSIEFQIYYKESHKDRPITYELEIAADKNRRPYVKSETLKQGLKGQGRGRPFIFLYLSEGEGVAWKGTDTGKEINEDQSSFDTRSLFDIRSLMEETKSKSNTKESRAREVIQLQDKRKLGIATLGALKQHPRIAAFREFIEGWYLSYFTPDAARSLPLAGPQKHLNVHGDNLGNVTQFMEREHPKRFQCILNQIADKIPGIDKIETERSPDGRLLLRFNDRGFKKPFYSQQMSDGTLKLFAYLLLLEDPDPPPLICIEEPENGLYHKLLETLADEFREHAGGTRGSPQLFITTHQPYFVNALQPAEAWILEKGKKGFAKISRADKVSNVQGLVETGEIPLGSLWYSGYLDKT